MRICYLSAANSYHTQKWCQYFSEKGHEVYLISLTEGTCSFADTRIVKTSMTDRHDSGIKKMEYLLHGKDVKRILQTIRPDIIHAHRIPSYGGLCAFGGIKPFVLSLWGGDVFTFPKKSFIHKFLVKYTLRKADCIMSTSVAMKDEASKYTDKGIEITPFGVDMDLFSPMAELKDNHEFFTIGTVKTLEKVYGIEFIIQAAAIVMNKRKDIPLRIRIAGKGSQEKSLREMSKELGVDKIIHWLGFITQEEAAKEWNIIDIAIIPSRSESFGVSAVEAQACETPVIISDIPGLKEATCPDVSSVVVPMESPESIAEEIIRLYDHPELRKKMGEDGRQFVLSRYERSQCFANIEGVYERLLAEPKWRESSWRISR